MEIQAFGTTILILLEHVLQSAHSCFLLLEGCILYLELALHYFGCWDLEVYLVVIRHQIIRHILISH